MYCILVAGIPASGKSAIAAFLSERFKLPVLSKDAMKEILFDEIGFASREEKVRLGTASAKLLYYAAGQLMQCGRPFILENNFEDASRQGLLDVLEKYGYTAVTVMLTGDYRAIYTRFLAREKSPQRHRGHVVNDRYPEDEERRTPAPISYEGFVAGITGRGMDRFMLPGPRIVVDTTDFGRVKWEKLLEEIQSARDEIERE